MRFPSPLGEMGLSISCYGNEYLGYTYMFPSPLGEMGLSIAALSARPLMIIMQVSVPSRGNGVIDLAVGTWSARASGARSFRPLSGKWGYRLTVKSVRLYRDS